MIVAGLDQDFRRLPFGPMPELFYTPSSSNELPAGSAIAAAGLRRRPSDFVDGSPASYSGETVVVGAAEQYEARCRGCHEPGIGAALAAA